MAGESFVSPVLTSTAIKGLWSKVTIKSISFLSMFRSNNRDKMSESTHIIVSLNQRLVPMVAMRTFCFDSLRLLLKMMIIIKFDSCFPSKVMALLTFNMVVHSRLPP
jgi:hypothetical protein